MIDAIWDFLSTEGFQPHGMCLLWRPDVFWTQIVSDLLIAMSYFSIPAALLYLANRRPDLMYRWVIYLFGAFIIACGATHIAAIWTMWVPDYAIEALVKVVTAIVSVVTAIALWPLMPKLLATPSTRQLEEKNDELQTEIADRRRAESKLQDLNEQLERRVAERTASLSEMNAQLNDARIKADRANASKSQFLANMSHEIRTPMNGVLGAADILRRMDLNEEQQEFLEIIRNSGGTLLELLNDILDLSKIESGNVELEETEFSIDELLGSVKVLWLHPAEERGLSLTVKNGLTDCDWIKGDHNRLSQILNNLVSNAIKFTEHGEITVNVEEVSRRDGKIELRFAVRDTGIGISEEQKERLFQPFSQADGSTTRKYGGTGLGLSICKRLVALMDGEIDVESVPGKGATFWFTVCVGRNGNEAAGPGVRVRTADSSPAVRSDRTVRILVADDNQVNRQVLSWMLASLDCTVDTVENGLEAVAAVARADYDLVLMDVRMPEMDGVAATREIRSLDGPKGRIPIIAITANAMQGDREKYLEAGMSDYVSKPIDQRELMRAIARCAAMVETEIEESDSESPAEMTVLSAALDQEAAS